MAKSDIGVLSIHLEAVTGDFDKGLKDAESKVTKFEGKISGTGKLFTELKSKLELYAAGIESAFKLATAGVQLLQGDIEDVRSTLGSIPTFGPVIESVWAFVDVLSGAAAEAERLKKAAEAKEMWDAWTANAKAAASDVHAAMMGAFSSAEEQALRFKAEKLRHKGDVKGAQAFEESAMQESFMPRLDAIEKAKIDAIAKLEREMSEKLAEARKKGIDTNTRIEMREHYKDLIEETRTLHNNQLKALEIERERAALALDISQAAELQQMAEAKARKEQERIVAIERERLKLQKEISARYRQAHTVRQQSVSGRSDSFSSPMGTIQLPSMTSAVELARKQLTELGQIEAQIRNLRAEVKALAA